MSVRYLRRSLTTMKVIADRFLAHSSEIVYAVKFDIHHDGRKRKEQTISGLSCTRSGEKSSWVDIISPIKNLPLVVPSVRFQSRVVQNFD